MKLALCHLGLTRGYPCRSPKQRVFEACVSRVQKVLNAHGQPQQGQLGQGRGLMADMHMAEAGVEAAAAANPAAGATHASESESHQLSLAAARMSLQAATPDTRTLCAVRVAMLECTSLQLSATHAGTND